MKKISDEWWSSPTESESGRLVIVTGRDEIDEIRNSGKYNYRIDVKWKYNSLADGMPDREDAKLMEEVHDALHDTFAKDPVAVMTGVYTGDGERDWVFYTTSLFLFQKVFNRALESLPVIPFVINAEEDPEWEEYTEMRDISYINPGE